MVFNYHTICTSIILFLFFLNAYYYWSNNMLCNTLIRPILEISFLIMKNAILFFLQLSIIKLIWSNAI